jgi:nucleoside-diphosphate-sugar epimerase
VWRGIAEGLNAVIVNPSIVLGPGNWDAGSPQVFQTMWKGLKFYTSGTNGFVDVNDVAKAMILLMESDISGERFILNSENITYKQFFEWMATAMHLPVPKYKAGPLLSGIGWRAIKIMSLFTGKPSSITKETAETANQHYRYSNQKIKAATGMDFLPVKESVEQTVKLFLGDVK